MGNYFIGKNEILFKFCLLMRISEILIGFKLKIITFITLIDERDGICSLLFVFPIIL